MTQYRQADHCFMLDDGFDDVFSTDMDDWFKVCTLHFSAVLTVTSYRSYRKSPCQPGKLHTGEPHGVTHTRPIFM